MSAQTRRSRLRYSLSSQAIQFYLLLSFRLFDTSLSARNKFLRRVDGTSCLWRQSRLSTLRCQNFFHCHLSLKSRFLIFEESGTYFWHQSWFRQKILGSLSSFAVVFRVNQHQIAQRLPPFIVSVSKVLGEPEIVLELIQTVLTPTWVESSTYFRMFARTVAIFYLRFHSC